MKKIITGLVVMGLLAIAGAAFADDPNNVGAPPLSPTQPTTITVNVDPWCYIDLADSNITIHENAGPGNTYPYPTYTASTTVGAAANFTGTVTAAFAGDLPGYNGNAGTTTATCDLLTNGITPTNWISKPLTVTIAGTDYLYTAGTHTGTLTVTIHN